MPIRRSFSPWAFDGCPLLARRDRARHRWQGWRRRLGRTTKRHRDGGSRVPVIFGPMLEKARNLRRDGGGPTADRETQERVARPGGRRIALGVLVAGTLGAVGLYLRRLARRDDDTADVQAAID